LSKLLRLRKWVRLPEAATYLTGVLGEPVTEADLLTEALEGRLSISVDLLNGGVGRRTHIVTQDHVRTITGLEGEKVYLGEPLSDGRYLKYEEDIDKLKGIWRLPLIGGEIGTLRQRLQELVGGPDVDAVCLAGSFLEGRDGQLIQLQELSDRKPREPGKFVPIQAEDYYPAGRLPEDCVLGLLMEDLRKFEQLVSDSSGVDRPLQTRERRTLLIIIAGLCNELKIDPGSHGAAKRIAAATERIGAPVSADTIGKMLESLRDAVESRKK
jgi:hypothetical protein